MHPLQAESEVPPPARHAAEDQQVKRMRRVNVKILSCPEQEEQEEVQEEQEEAQATAH